MDATSERKLYRDYPRLCELTRGMYAEGGGQLCIVPKSNGLHTSLGCSYSRLDGVQVSEMGAAALRSHLARGRFMRMPDLAHRSLIRAKHCNVCMLQFHGGQRTLRDHFDAVGISAAELGALPRPVPPASRERVWDARELDELRAFREEIAASARG